MSKNVATPLIELAEQLEEKELVISPWDCILFNDEVHSFDEVIFQIMKATGYNPEKAASITVEVHNKGKAIVYSGEIADCLKVSSVLEEIYLLTEIQG